MATANFARFDSSKIYALKKEYEELAEFYGLHEELIPTILYELESVEDFYERVKNHTKHDVVELGLIENENHKIKILLTIGYYQGATLDYEILEYENDGEVDDVLDEVEKIFELFCNKYRVSVSFSNGETWYERIDE